MIKSVTIVGPYATEYSLAKVNRALALALAKNFPELKVRLWANEDYCDRLPSSSEFARYPFLKDLSSKEAGNPDVVIFNNFPKSQFAPYGLKSLPGRIKLAYLAWEESIFPERWVRECNEQLHGLLVSSEHVYRVFRNSGISIPMQVVAEGLDIPYAKEEPYKLKSHKKFKFLHVSSGQYRKGTDILLKAYLKEFKASDDVTLILKLFPNASQNKELEELLAKRDKNSPEIELIRDADLSDGQLRSLYEQSNAVVLPSRAEGFGLPMAEAMYLNKPLITTGFSGHLDFCNKNSSYLIDYKLKDSQSHLNIPGSKLAEPSEAHLGKLMSYLYTNSESEEVKEKVTKAHERAKELSWQSTASQSMDFIKNLDGIEELKDKKLALVSTWNSRCGIAEYSREMYKPIQSSFKELTVYANSDIGDRTAADEDFVKRLWQYGEMDFKSLVEEFKRNKPDILHFQYNLSFYSHVLMGRIIKQAKELGITVYATLHSTQPGMSQSLADLSLADRIFVHNEPDLELLTSLGLRNAELAYHGVSVYPEEDREALALRLGVKSEHVIASHGLIHDKKGVLETLEAVKILKKDIPDILYLAVNALNPNNGTSAAIYNKMQEYVKANKLENNVLLISEFLEQREVIKLLHLSHLIVLAYSDIQEGVSGAVRTCIAAKRPLLLSESYIFRNLNIGTRIATNEPQKVAMAVKELFKDSKALAENLQEVRNFAEENTWERISLAYLQKLSL